MYDINDKIFLCDWIQGTLDMRNVNEVFEFLCSFDCFDMRFFTKFSSGFLNYKERWGYNDTGIVQIAWNACDDDNTKALIFSDDRPKGINGGILLSISGDGLRKIGYENHNRLFKWLYEHDFRCTRFDVAMDIFDPNNLLVPCIIEAWEGVNGNEYGKNTISTLMNKNNFVIHTYSDSSRKCMVKNVEIQQNKGHLGRFKMYDKWYEVHKLPRLRAQAEELCKDVPAEYWYRLEYTIKTEYSESLFKSFCENNYPLEMLFKWAVGRMFTIKVAKTAGYQTGNLDTNSVWIDLISYLDKVTESRSLNFNLAKYEWIPNDGKKYFINSPVIAAKYILLGMSDPEFLNKTLSLGLDSLLSKNRHKEYLEVMEKDLKLNIDLLSDCINNKGFSIELCSNVDDNIPVFGGIPLPFGD